MSSVFETSGLPNHIWAGGVPLTSSPAPISVLPRRFESQQRTSNLGTRIDRCFIDDGYPNVLTRLELSMQWKNVSAGAVRDHLTALASIGQPFDVALFKQETDFFDGDGSTKDFVLQRRVVGDAFKAAAAAAFPGVFTDYPDYPLRAILYSSPYGTIGASGTTVSTVVYKNSSNIDTGNPSSGEIWIEEDGHLEGNLLVSKIRLHDAPISGHDVLRVTYLPLMRMFLGQDSGRTFDSSQMMGRSLRFVEQ